VSRQPYPASSRKRAREVLAEFNLDTHPIDPDWIATQRGIRIVTENRFPKDCFGALVRRGNEFVILVSAGCFNVGHRRFTIGHELGHFHLEGHIDALISRDAPALSFGANYTNQKDPFEIEADAFASELLMPTPPVTQAIAGRRPGLNVVQDLARDFVVSVSAAAVRLAMLSAEPVVVLLSRDHVLEWAAFSPAFDGHAWIRRRRRGDWAPPRSATTLLARDVDQVRSGATRSDNGVLSEWFDGAPNAAVDEEALGLGHYGRVLTILTCENLPDPDEEQERMDIQRGPGGDWRDALRSYRLD
jgi:Zn-dependent peptidase ImmA (M78 family)